MPTIQQLLEIDLGLLAVLSGSVILLLRRALKQGRAKKALQNSLASAQAPIAATPFVSGRTAQPAVVPGTVSNEAAASVFAPQHAVPQTRRPLWSDAMPVVHEDLWITEAIAPQQTELAYSNEIFFSDEPVEEPIVAAIVEEPATPELPREQVGILFLDEDRDLSTLKLAGVTEISPRTAPREPVTLEGIVVETPVMEFATVEFIDGLYADPIDGVPFTPGEEVTPCACGTAYRLETADWLREEANGECVQCHRKLTGEVVRIPEDAKPALMAASA